MHSRVHFAILAAALLTTHLHTNAQEPPASKAEPNAAPKTKAPAPKTASKPSQPARPRTGLPNPNAPLVPKPTNPVPLPEKKKAKLPYEKRVNLNAATREDLMKLPTVDGPTADRIIAGRPYKTTGDLLVKGAVPGAHFYTVKDLVTAGPMPGQPSGTPSPKK